MSRFKTIQHVSLLVADIGRSLQFYSDILGMELDAARPEMDFNGAWLKINDDQQIHLLELPNPDPVTDRPLHAGRDRHTAFAVDRLQDIEERLAREAISFTRSRSGRKALFFRDPDGNGIELIELGD